MATTKNTRIVSNETLAKVIKPTHFRKLMRFSKATGHAPHQAVDRALEFWLEVEAPVYLAHAKKAKKPAVRR